MKSNKKNLYLKKLLVLFILGNQFSDFSQVVSHAMTDELSNQHLVTNTEKNNESSVGEESGDESSVNQFSDFSQVVSHAMTDELSNQHLVTNTEKNNESSVGEESGDESSVDEESGDESSVDEELEQSSLQPDSYSNKSKKGLVRNQEMNLQ